MGAPLGLFAGRGQVHNLCLGHGLDAPHLTLYQAFQQLKEVLCEPLVMRGCSPEPLETSLREGRGSGSPVDHGDPILFCDGADCLGHGAVVTPQKAIHLVIQNQFLGQIRPKGRVALVIFKNELNLGPA